AELVALVLAEHPPREREAAARAREMVVEVDAEQARVEVHGNDLARHGDGRRAAAAHHRAAAALSAGPDLSSQGGMRPRARLLVLCGVALAGAGPAAALAAPLTLDGAYTAARQGKTARQILGLAFPGARIGSARPAVVRVLVADLAPRVVVAGSRPLRMIDEGRRRAAPRQLLPGHRYRLLRRRGSFVLDDLDRPHSRALLRGPVRIQPGSARAIRLAGPLDRRYRGTLRVVAAACPTKRGVNPVDLEQYGQGTPPEPLP